MSSVVRALIVWVVLLVAMMGKLTQRLQVHEKNAWMLRSLLE